MFFSNQNFYWFFADWWLSELSHVPRKEWSWSVWLLGAAKQRGAFGWWLQAPLLAVSWTRPWMQCWRWLQGTSWWAFLAAASRMRRWCSSPAATPSPASIYPCCCCCCWWWCVLVLKMCESEQHPCTGSAASRHRPTGVFLRSLQHLPCSSNQLFPTCRTSFSLDEQFLTWKYMSVKKLTGEGRRSRRWRLESCSRRVQRVLQWCSSTPRRIDTEQIVPCIYMHTHSEKKRRHYNLQYSFGLSSLLHLERPNIHQLGSQNKNITRVARSWTSTQISPLWILVLHSWNQNTNNQHEKLPATIF